MINDQVKKEYANTKMQYKTIYLAELLSKYIRDNIEDLDNGIMEDLLELTEMILSDFPIMINKITDDEERNVAAIRTAFNPKGDEQQ